MAQQALTMDEFKAICKWFYESGEQKLGFEAVFESFKEAKINL